MTGRLFRPQRNQVLVQRRDVGAQFPRMLAVPGGVVRVRLEPFVLLLQGVLLGYQARVLDVDRIVR